MGPNLFARNENSAYVMPHVTAHAVTSCVHHVACTCRQAGHPYINMACQKLLMDMPCAPAKPYLSKITTSHFSTLNTKIANWNMLKRILIAMHNENEADCNENFSRCDDVMSTSCQHEVNHDDTVFTQDLHHKPPLSLLHF